MNVSGFIMNAISLVCQKELQLMIWNRETRYTPYNDWPTETLNDLRKQVKKSKWRMNHHIQPDSGLLNDPNGFSYFNNQWHLFYQVFPYGPVHGLKSWQHLTSNNLVDWHDEGLAIKPDSKLDSHGAYTGTAIPVEDKLFIMYTGNVRTKDWQRQSFQNGAWMSRDNKVQKMSIPLIEQAPTGYTSSFRDPYLIKQNNKYYAIIGGQTNSEKGSALVYSSVDLKKWKFNGSLNLPEDISGFMIECPNLVFIDNQPILIFCPQGLDRKQLNYQNIYPNVYSVADAADLETAQLKNIGSVKQLDDGFDVYATEAFNAPDGRALAVSWIGLPEISYPTDSENWAHCLSIIKDLSLKDGHLYQNPVIETEQLRINEQKLSTKKQIINLDPTNGSFEVELTIPKDTNLDLSITNQKQTGDLKILLDSTKGQVTIDRSNTGHSFGEKYGQIRSSQVTAHKALKIRLIIDVSVFECYIDNGYSVITGRFFLDDLPSKLELETKSSDAEGTIWEWRK